MIFRYSRRKKGGASTFTRDAKEAIYFTNSRKAANDYALNAGVQKNPRAKNDYESGENFMPVFLSIQNPHRVSVLDYNQDLFTIETSRAKKQGNDGVFFVTDWGPTSYAVFSPSKIKSATGNRGTFNLESADITLSMAAEQSGWWRGKGKGPVKAAARNLFRETTPHAVRTDKGKLEKLREDVEAMRAGVNWLSVLSAHTTSHPTVYAPNHAHPSVFVRSLLACFLAD